jgi:hypothetical protein
MMSPTLISFASGLVSALLFSSGTTGTGLGGLLMTMSALPLFIAGLGFGTRGALISTGTGVLVVSLVLAGAAPPVYFAFSALPALVLSYLALLYRLPQPISARPDEQPGPGQAEWFPTGSLVLATVVLSSLSVSIVLYAAFGGAGQYQDTMRQALEPLIDSLAGQLSQGAPPEDVANLKERLLNQASRAVPAVFALASMLVTLVNLWLGGYVARRSGLLQRPWVPLDRLDYPKYAAAALVAAFLASQSQGFIGVAGMAFTGTLVFAYFLLGAISIIALTAGSSLRPFAVVAIILSVILEPLALFIAVFGLVESFIQLRARRAARASGPAGP